MFDSEWISLYNGNNLSGWTANDNPDSWVVEDGSIVTRGPKSHLFYTGLVSGALFRNFEIHVDVLTEPGANGGLYFHTEFQQTGWPERGWPPRRAPTC